jgi:hypothetical protein
MSLPELAARARAKQQSRKKKKKVQGHRPLGIAGHDGAKLLDEQVLTSREWCALNGIGTRTGRRILDGPNSPEIVRLSARRIGITVRANREWQQSRSRPAGEGER